MKTSSKSLSKRSVLRQLPSSYAILEYYTALFCQCSVVPVPQFLFMKHKQKVKQMWFIYSDLFFEQCGSFTWISSLKLL